MLFCVDITTTPFSLHQSFILISKENGQRTFPGLQKINFHFSDMNFLQNNDNLVDLGQVKSNVRVLWHICHTAGANTIASQPATSCSETSSQGLFIAIVFSALSFTLQFQFSQTHTSTKKDSVSTPTSL